MENQSELMKNRENQTERLRRIPTPNRLVASLRTPPGHKYMEDFKSEKFNKK
jgi:hypothetical protein